MSRFLSFLDQHFSLFPDPNPTPKSETPDQNSVERFYKHIYIYIHTDTWVGLRFRGWVNWKQGPRVKRGGDRKSGVFGQKVEKDVDFWKSDKFGVFWPKRGSKSRFRGGGRKTHPLKVDRIYGETFCVVITGEVFLEVTFGVKKHEICHFLSLFSLFSTFRTFRTFWPVNPHPKIRPPKTTRTTQKWFRPPKSTPKKGPPKVTWIWSEKEGEKWLGFGREKWPGFGGEKWPRFGVTKVKISWGES